MAEAGRSETFEIKRRLLRSAWDGKSKRTGPEMIALILTHFQRAHDIPIDHEMALGEIDDSEPRSVRALNLLEKERGTGVTYTAKNPSTDPGPTLH